MYMLFAVVKYSDLLVFIIEDMRYVHVFKTP